MKTLIKIFALCLFLFIAGCSERSDISPVSAKGSTLAKDINLPFSTTFYGIAHLTPTGPYSAISLMEGRGNAAHVGSYTSISRNEWVYTSATTGNVLNGTHTSFAANGDELYGTYTGTFVIGEGLTTITVNFIFNGGTGRFKNVYAEFQVTCTTDDVGQLTQEISGSGSGWIRY